jgi:hypothetical protein
MPVSKMDELMIRMGLIPHDRARELRQQIRQEKQEQRDRQRQQLLSKRVSVSRES